MCKSLTNHLSEIHFNKTWNDFNSNKYIIHNIWKFQFSICKEAKISMRNMILFSLLNYPILLKSDELGFFRNASQLIKVENLTLLFPFDTQFISDLISWSYHHFIISLFIRFAFLCLILPHFSLCLRRNLKIYLQWLTLCRSNKILKWLLNDPRINA